MSRATIELWWLALSALAFGLTALGPLAASTSAADPYIGGLLVFYAAMHAVPVALELLAVATRRVQWVGSAAAGAGVLLAWLIVGFMDALGPTFGDVEPDVLAVLRVVAVLSLSFAVLVFLASARGRERPW